MMAIKLNQFYQPELEMNKLNTVTRSWMIVHTVTEESPLYGFIQAAFDDMFGRTTVARSSYPFKEFIVGAKFNSLAPHFSPRRFSSPEQPI